MLRWSLIFLVLALVAALFGFAGLVVAELMLVAKVLFFLFLAIFVVSLVMSRRTPTGTL